MLKLVELPRSKWNRASGASARNVRLCKILSSASSSSSSMQRASCMYRSVCVTKKKIVVGYLCIIRKTRDLIIFILYIYKILFCVSPVQLHLSTILFFYSKKKKTFHAVRVIYINEIECEKMLDCNIKMKQTNKQKTPCNSRFVV